MLLRVLTRALLPHHFPRPSLRLAPACAASNCNIKTMAASRPLLAGPGRTRTVFLRAAALPPPPSPGLFPQLARRLHLRASRWPARALQSAADRAGQSDATAQLPRPAPAGAASAAAPAAARTQAGSPPTPAAAAAAAPGRTYLREVYIKDFALVDEQQLVLEPGLNVITGERAQRP